MATKIERLMDEINKLPTAERAKLEAQYNKLGSTKKKWLAFGAGVVVASLLWIGGLVLFGCHGEPKAVQTGPNSACFPGPRVIE